MDLMNEFYDLSKPVMKVRQATGLADGLYVRESDVGQEVYYEEAEGDDGYEYVEEERSRVEASGGLLAEDPVQLMKGLSLLSSFDPTKGLECFEAEATEKVFAKFRFDTEVQANLPVFKQRKQIVDTINKYKVTILNGMTGCGKTTQVPQYILDDCYERKAFCNILVTQPRRIAAITVAERVSDEREWPRGTLCGYQIGLNQQLSEDTRLLYCTTGIFKEILLSTKDLTRYSHIFLDEVHERTLDLDFVLLIIKQLLPKFSTKLILMSATMNPQIFKDYFSPMACQILHISSPMRHQVAYYYMDDLIEDDHLDLLDNDFCGYDLNKPEFTANMAVTVCRVIVSLCGLHTDCSTRNNGFLVFLPGYAEIEAVQKELQKHVEGCKAEGRTPPKWAIFALHSSVPNESQKMAFRTYKDHRKIILATNIAESSITVSDAETVIDLCLTKHLAVDEGTGLCTLRLAWASKHNCTQRAGRVGRVGPGRVYRIVSRAFYESLPEQGPPEMETAPLEGVVLKTKLLGMGEPLTVLAHALNPPRSHDVRRAVMNLKQAGGLLLEKNGEFNRCDGDLTFLGKIMANLPVDIKVAKLIALGHVLGVLDDAIVIGACLTVPGIFTTPFQKNFEAYQAMVSYCCGTIKSDLLAARIAFQVYKDHALNCVHNSADNAQLEIWCKARFLQLRALREIDHLVVEIESRLKSKLDIEHIIDRFQPWLNDEKKTVLTLAIAGAFYPNYYVSRIEDDSLETRALKELSNRNPFTTVYLSNFPTSQQPGSVYYQAIADMFRRIDPQVRVSTDPSSEKVFIEFSPDNPDDKKFSKRICHSVYFAMMLGRCKEVFRLGLMSPHKAKEWFERYNAETEAKMMTVKCRRETSNLPSLVTTTISVHLVRIEHPGHFWSWNGIDPQKCLQMRNDLENDLSHSRHLPSTEMPIVGGLYIYRDGQICKRARVEYIVKKKDKNENIAIIVLIDYAERMLVDPYELHLVGRDVERKFYETPGFTYECQLANVEAKYVLAGYHRWADPARKKFHELTTRGEMFGKIYSVVDGVIRITLYVPNDDPNDEPLNVNEELITLKYGIRAAESFQSEQNHNHRCSFNLDPSHVSDLEESQRPSFKPPQIMLPRPPPDLCRGRFTNLKGPKSPLLTTLDPLQGQQHGLSVNIAIGSLNAILMNEDPQENRQQVIVAAHVTKSQSGAAVTLHQTTEMPDVMGIGSVMAVLFAPRVEYRPNIVKTRYASARCGMGVDERGRPRNSENDFDVVFDTEFTNTDAQLVNDLRLWMSQLLSGNSDDLVSSYLSKPEHVQAIKAIRKILHDLLRERFKERREYPEQPDRWGLTKPKEFLPVPVDHTEGHIYPAHPITALQNPEELFNDVERLIFMDTQKIPFKPSECLLCKEFLQSEELLKAHLFTYKHKDRSKALKYHGGVGRRLSL